MKEIFRRAERGTHDDVSALVARVPALMREAARRRGEPESPFDWALPRLAIATAGAVVLAAAVVIFTGSGTSTFESLILGADEATGDVLFDALVGVERADG